MINNLTSSILETSSLATFVLDNRQIIIANHAVERVFGWKPEELIGQSMRSLYPTEDLYKKIDEEIYTHIEKKHLAIRSDYRCKHKDGRIIFCRLNASRIVTNPKKERVIVTYEDITEARETELKLVEKETLYRTLMERTLAGVYVAQDGYFKYLNQRAMSDLGYRPDELIGRKVDSLVHVEDRDNLRISALKMLNGREMVPYKYRVLTRKGEIRWIMETVTSVVYEGKPAVLGNNMDITELHEAKTKIEEFNELKSSILDATPHAIIYVENRKIIFANNAVESVFGWKPEELTGKSIRMLFRSDEDYRKVGKVVYDTLERERFCDQPVIVYKHKDGREVICHSKSVRIGESLHNLRNIGAIENITEQIQTQNALQQKTKELEIKTQNLEETNITLNVILKRREADKLTIEENVVNNVRKLIMPCIQQMKKYHMDTSALKYASLAESYLVDIVSPFIRKLSTKHLQLTHKEVLVANLLKSGKTSKEISDLLNITVKGVEFHRDKIRSKLGIKNTATNLSSYLLSLDSNEER